MSIFLRRKPEQNYCPWKKWPKEKIKTKVQTGQDLDRLTQQQLDFAFLY